MNSLEAIVRNPNFRKSLPLFLSISFVSALVLNYKKNSLGDADYYVRNGGEIISRINPYESGFRSGPLGAIFLNLSFNNIPVGLAEPLILASGLVGSFVLISIIFPKYQVTCFLLLPISILFASNRELLVNHQINGIIWILISAYVILIKRTSKFFFLIGTFSAAVALDLKPHISIPIFLVLFLIEKNFTAVAGTAFWILLAHMLCDLWLGSITEITWLRNLADISKDNPWADIANIWPLLSYLPVAEQLVKNISILIYLFGLITLAGTALITSNKKLILMAFGTPVIGLYCHLYDLGPLILLTLVLHTSSKNPMLLYLYLNLAVVFKSFNSMEGVILLIIANLLFFLVRNYSNKKGILHEILGLVLGLATYLGYQITMNFFAIPENDFKSFTICLVALLSLSLLYIESLPKRAETNAPY